MIKDCEKMGGEVEYLTLENFTGAAGFESVPGYKGQCVIGFSKMLENQYDYYVEEGILDRSVELWEYLDGMMPREFEYSQYTEVWKKTAHSFLDVLVIPTMIEAVTGVEFITGDHLTDNEQAGKAVQSLIQNADGYNGQAIKLLSCNTGALDNGFAQNLANKLNVEVYAPTNYLWSTPSGNYFVAGMTKTRMPDMNNKGIFKIFKPGGNR